MKKGLIFIIAGLLAGLLAGIAVYKSISNRIPSNPSDLIGNTAGNLNSGGLFCETGGTVFFANPYDSNRLYSMTPDCADIRCISEDSVSYINAAGKYIYYIRDNGSFADDSAIFKGDMYGLARCKLDGSSLHTLVSGYCTDLAVSGDTLVYKTNRNSKTVTCTVDIRGGESSVINEYNISHASVFNGSLFYSDGASSHSIYNMDISDGLSSLYMTGNTYMANYVDNNLYYIDLDNNYALTKVDLSTNIRTVISNDRCVLYNVYNGIIYYQAENSGNHALYRIKADGSDRTEIISGDIATISCTSKFTFFQMHDSTTLYRVPTFGEPTVQTLYIQPQE
ncbi:MAG: DUF5050 domain-containing protein [Butyrivibrio sp.]|nr:DUF5050 domain-containing protein [Butyrivibrio sp.]